ncbi:MAG: exo-alpha-sialidase [Verrucomicrobia bacterium]|nr:exo-alpha-sialidase [Verrucomicrobiota bacterium]
MLTAFFAARHASDEEFVAPAGIATTRRSPIGFNPGDTVPFFSHSWITPRGHTPVAHCSVISALPSGDLLAVWYGGSREGAADVALFTARLPSASNSWTRPVKALDRAAAQDELDRRIKKIGNAVIFPDRTGSLWMVYVSVTVGGWSGAALNIKTSQDEGRTWSHSRRLTLNPFLNFGSLVRNRPIYANDGRIGLPVYHETALKFPQVLWLTPGPTGSVREYRMRSLPAETGLIQPALVPLDHDRVLMMLRDRSDGRRLHTAYSNDNGWTWSEAAPSGLPNSDSAIDALRLRDGRILLVYNDAASGRENLRLAVSDNNGRSWQPGAIIEAEVHEEFSYPYLLEDSRGRIHLTYTWHRQRIKHVEFNLAWLDRRAVAETASLR